MNFTMRNLNVGTCVGKKYTREIQKLKGKGIGLKIVLCLLGRQ